MSRDSILRALVPLKVMVLSEGPSPVHKSIFDAISRAFRGSMPPTESSEAYYPEGEDLGVQVLDVGFSGTGAGAKQMVDKARQESLRVLVVALLHNTPSEDLGQWLNELEKASQTTSGLSFLPFNVREGAWQHVPEPINYTKLGESALCPGYAAAYVLIDAWHALADKGLSLKIFISHAKLDGLPLAQSFKEQLVKFPVIKKFYDVDDIPPGSKWRKVLENGVESSVVISLRTNIYEERFWCVQEMDWAEEFGCPVVVVDGRTRLVRAREFLPINGAPSVHVPDGNLLRALQSTLREALRVQLFVAQVNELVACCGLATTDTLRVPRTSLATLGIRCQRHVDLGHQASFVFLPESFREAHAAVAERLVKSYFPNAWLGTPRAFIEKQVTTSDE